MNKSDYTIKTMMGINRTELIDSNIPDSQIITYKMDGCDSIKLFLYKDRTVQIDLFFKKNRSPILKIKLSHLFERIQRSYWIYNDKEISTTTKRTHRYSIQLFHSGRYCKVQINTFVLSGM